MSNRCAGHGAELFVKAPRSGSLSDFTEHLAKLIQSDPWEERESVNYPGGHCFRQQFGQLEIVAQVADDTEYLDADFLVWGRQGEDSAGHMDTLARALDQNGYALMAKNEP
jgi:hypothetical protein